MNLGIETFRSYQITITPCDMVMNDIRTTGLNRNNFEKAWMATYGSDDCEKEFQSYCFSSYKDKDLSFMDTNKEEWLCGEYRINPIMPPHLFSDHLKERIDGFGSRYYIINAKSNIGTFYEYEVPGNEDNFNLEDIRMNVVEDLSKVGWIGGITKAMLNGGDTLMNVLFYKDQICRCVDIAHKMIGEKEYLTLVDQNLIPIPPYIDIDISDPQRPLYLTSVDEHIDVK